MIYKLFNEPQYSCLKQILINRGISEEKIQEWLNAGWPQINSPWAFGEEKVKHAIKLMNSSLFEARDFYVVVDCDVDGFTSAAIIMNYLYKVYPERIDNFNYILHEGKQHGLQDIITQIPNNCLVILPDSSTNDVKEMRELLERGCLIVCMDHHEADNYLEDEENLVIINNQIGDYPNKDLSAAGVVWQICRAWDELYNYNYANDFIDLAALGLLSDMMKFTSVETKAIIDIGLNHISNPFFYEMVSKNKFSIDKMGGINYMSIAFYVTPFVNAIVRSGTMEEKDIVFESFLQIYAFKKVESGKRGHKGELVPRVEEAVRIATNVKARQTKAQDAAMLLLEQRIKEQNLLKNSIILLLCEPGEIERNLQGLVANKIQAKYQRPCLVLTKNEDCYAGSARNYSMSEIQDLRQLCLDTGLLEYGSGHANAWGAAIKQENIPAFIEKTNLLYENISKEPVYWVDFIWTKNQVSPQDILTIAEAKDLWGQDVPEPYICLKDIPLDSVSIQLLSADKNPTLKIHLDCGVDIMKFKSSQEEYEEFCSPNAILTAICRCNKNEWNGRVTAQLMIEDFDLREEWIF